MSTTTTVIYTYCPTHALPAALPNSRCGGRAVPTRCGGRAGLTRCGCRAGLTRCGGRAVLTRCGSRAVPTRCGGRAGPTRCGGRAGLTRSEEHTSELQSLMRISYAVFCLTKTQPRYNHNTRTG